MLRPPTTSQQSPVTAFQNQLSAPLLFLSSEGVGWHNLVVKAYHEPTELKEWISPPIPDTALILLTSGTMLIEQRRKNDVWTGVPLHRGDFLLRPGDGPTREVRWKSLSSAPMQTLHIHLDHRLLRQTAEEITDRDPGHLSIVGRSGFQDPLLNQIGLSLWRELEQKAPAGRIYAQTAAQMLAVHLLRHYASVTVDIKERRQGLTRTQMTRVTDYVRAHLSESLSLDDLAHQVGFSAYHFARLFRQAVGQSPHQFVLCRRLEHAQRLLRKTDLSLTQVALESGFSTHSHLTQVFKRSLGLTPRAYRKNA